MDEVCGAASLGASTSGSASCGAPAGVGVGISSASSTLGGSSCRVLGSVRGVALVSSSGLGCSCTLGGTWFGLKRIPGRRNAASEKPPSLGERSVLVFLAALGELLLGAPLIEVLLPDLDGVPLEAPTDVGTVESVALLNREPCDVCRSLSASVEEPAALGAMLGCRAARTLGSSAGVVTVAGLVGVASRAPVLAGDSALAGASALAGTSALAGAWASSCASGHMPGRVSLMCGVSGESPPLSVSLDAGPSAASNSCSSDDS